MGFRNLLRRQDTNDLCIARMTDTFLKKRREGSTPIVQVKKKVNVALIPTSNMLSLNQLQHECLHFHMQYATE
ncbi:hypothetical protein KIN20_035753 [Parelaphostrongylus tenuis]|uniref:Uncharacterized protein n=1 Tax=Parelaphostrongylus tenuis TaxID=148309 RepID=A0AAD5RCA6_PARTN|nr:hypothetical protein KIN20_035753 [Parelaphostrongylus tenuis]